MPHQVFISYAHADDLPMDKDVPGWVSAFVDKLQRSVVRQSGGGAIDFWMDHRLEPQRRVDDELRKRIRESAVILAVMSPRYLESEWCKKEMATFVQEVGGGVSDDRVFMVELLPTERTLWHVQAQNLTAVKFWQSGLTQPEPQTLGWPLPNVKGDRDYWAEVNTLATRLARQLKGLAPVDTSVSAPASTPTPAPLPSAPPSPPADGPINILVSTDSADESLAIEAQGVLETLKARVSIDFPPTETDDLAMHRANLEEQLRESHGVIVVYGEAPRSWVQTKVRAVRKVLAPAGESRDKVCTGLLDGPPHPKPPHGVSSRDALILNCKEGVSQEELNRFIVALRPGASHV